MQSKHDISTLESEIARRSDNYEKWMEGLKFGFIIISGLYYPVLSNGEALRFAKNNLEEEIRHRIQLITIKHCHG